MSLTARNVIGPECAFSISRIASLMEDRSLRLVAQARGGQGLAQSRPQFGSDGHRPLAVEHRPVRHRIDACDRFAVDDTTVIALVAGAYDLDPAFGLFIDVLASTGAGPRKPRACWSPTSRMAPCRD
jgi:hypothetical protein